MRRLQLAAQRRRLPAGLPGDDRPRAACRCAAPRTPSSTGSSPSAPRFGAPLLAARVPRACIDLNRAADDLDPALIAGASRRFLNPRIAAGLGVIPRVVGDGRPIMQRKLTLAEAQRRINDYWHPYHERLRALIAESRARFGIGDPLRLPLDAARGAERRAAVRRPPSRGGARRPLRRRLRPLADRGGRGGLRRARASPSPATPPSPAATSPRPTAGRTRACTRCRSRSTARSTWTRRGSSAGRSSTPSPRRSPGWCRSSPALGPRPLLGRGGMSKKRGRARGTAQV